MREMQESDEIVAVVDDDLSAREGLSSLIRSLGLGVRIFAPAHSPGTPTKRARESRQ